MTTSRDRARTRAIRARAARENIPYSVAARELTRPASHGRTVYPYSTDRHRQQLLDERARWTFPQRVADARRAADLPDGRAEHLVVRFPATRGEPGTGVRPLYAGADRRRVLSQLYRVIARDEPDLVPAVGDLAWEAELGEETAVDLACAALDRAARRLLDTDPARLRHRFASVGGRWPDALSLLGARDILDALLTVADDGHAPGTRVRLDGRAATVVAARWGPAGPPYAYEVLVDGAGSTVTADPDDLRLA